MVSKDRSHVISGVLRETRVPPNVRFEVDDVEADWTYASKFDFIFCRFMGNAVHDWPRLTRQTFE